jgi:hypothetical protein
VSGVKAQHGQTNYGSIGIILTGTHAETDIPIAAGTVSNLEVKTSVGIAGGTIVVTVLRNGAATGITCTVAVSATTCNDSTDSQAFSAGETIAFEVVNNSASGGQDPTLVLSAKFQ